MNTELENRFEDWYNDHMYECGTCKWRKKGCCDIDTSPAYGEKVSDNGGCDEWLEKY